MRNLMLIALLALAACSAQEQERSSRPVGFAARTVVFQTKPAGLSPSGRIRLLVPEKYDTLLAWVDAADTPWADQAKYRFTSSRGCLRQESGYKRPGSYCHDTLDRLTIVVRMSHSSAETLDQVAKRIKHLDERYNPTGTAATVWKSKKLAAINGRTFSIVESFGGNDLVAEPYDQVTAVTVVPGPRWNWEVMFQFDCKQRDCRGLARQAHTILKSVSIDTAAVRP